MPRPMQGALQSNNATRDHKISRLEAKSQEEYDRSEVVLSCHSCNQLRNTIAHKQKSGKQIDLRRQVPRHQGELKPDYWYRLEEIRLNLLAKEAETDGHP